MASRREVLVCVAPRVVAVVLALSCLLLAQAGPTFDVVSVKRNTVRGTAAFRVTPGRVTVTNDPLTDLVRNSYRVEPFQVVGGPDWTGTDRWDIIATARYSASAAELDAMMRVLLADRFKLIVHHETRQMPVYELALTQGDGQAGSQMHPSSTDCSAMPCGFRGGAGNMTAIGRTVVQLARVLTPLVGRPILDKTSLAGSFDWTLRWAPDAQAVSEFPSLFTAIREQLGLKLEPTTAAIDVLVIDHAERPSEN
jgi:uncharacterized protein (TIGR03435 family)